MGKQVSTGLWWPENTVYHGTYSCICWLYQAIQASYWSLVALVWELSSTKTWEDSTKAVIAYASRSLNKAESHYPAHKLEFLALKWAVVKKLHE